jgi:hypothetical protein
MPVVRYNPLELEDFPTGLRMFQDTVNRLLSEPGSRPWTPAVDIYETENDLVLSYGYNRAVCAPPPSGFRGSSLE